MEIQRIYKAIVRRSGMFYIIDYFNAEGQRTGQTCWMQESGVERFLDECESLNPEFTYTLERY